MHDHKRQPTIISRALGIVTVLLALPYAALAVDPLHPLGNNVTLATIIGRVISACLGLLGSISLVMFVWGGFTYMTASGNDDQVKKAKKTFRNAIIGLILSFASYAILRLVLGTIQTSLS